jgi:hypothetical protein
MILHKHPIDMHQISQHSAIVSYNPKPIENAGLSVAYYSGVISAPTLVDLRTRVIKSSPATRAFLVNMTSAALLMGVDPFIPTAADYSKIPHGVVICRPDQLQTMQAYSRYMATHGIIRGVFLQSESGRAMAMAYRLAEK